MATRADKLRGEVKAATTKLKKFGTVMASRHESIVKYTEAFVEIYKRMSKEAAAGGVSGNAVTKEKDLRLNLAHQNKLKGRSIVEFNQAAVQARRKLAEVDNFLTIKEKKKLFYRKTHPKIYKAEKELGKAVDEALEFAVKYKV